MGSLYDFFAEIPQGCHTTAGYQNFCILSGRTFHHQFSRSIEATGSGVKDRPEIWHARQKYCYRDPCQISEREGSSISTSSGSEILRDGVIRRFTTSRSETQKRLSMWIELTGTKLQEITTEHRPYTYSISPEICTRFLLCCALLWLYIDWFSHIHQAYFTGTVAI